MPITAAQKELLTPALLTEALNTGDAVENVTRLAGILYDSLIAAHFSGDEMVIAGKHVFAGVPWKHVPNVVRIKFYRAAEAMLPGLRAVVAALPAVPDAPDEFEAAPFEDDQDEETDDAAFDDERGALVIPLHPEAA